MLSLRRLEQDVKGTSSYAEEPTVQAYKVVMQSRTARSIQAKWVRGNGNTCLVLIKQASSVSDLTEAPADGTGYTANEVYGSGSQIGGAYVVYDGTSTSVNVVSLERGTSYIFKVFEYNGSGSTANYLTINATNNPFKISTAP